MSTRAAALGLVLFSAARAHAYPFLDTRIGGTPFEGPTDFEATGLWWNPAALAPMHGLRLTLLGNTRFDRGSVDRTPICTGTGRPGDCAPGTLKSFPSQHLANDAYTGFGAVTWNFNEDITVAFGVYTPWVACPIGSSCTNTSNSLSPSAYHIQKESFTSIYFSFAGAFRIIPKVFVGIAISLVDSFVDYTFYRDTALDRAASSGAPIEYEAAANAQKIRIRGDGGTLSNGGAVPSPTGVAANIGLLTHPTERFWLGASWQRVIPTSGSSYAASSPSGAQVYAPQGDPGSPCADPHPCSGGDSFLYAIPDVWQLGARILLRDDMELETWGRVVVYGGYYTPDPWQTGVVIRLSGDAIAPAKGNAPSQITVDHGFQPTFTWETGFRWLPRRSLRLGISTIGETSAVRMALTSAAALDGIKVDNMVGLEWQATRWLRLTAAYGITAYFPVHTTPLDPTPGGSGGDYNPTQSTSCVAAHYSLSACGEAIAGRGLPTADARYQLVRHHATVGVVLQF